LGAVGVANWVSEPAAAAVGWAHGGTVVLVLVVVGGTVVSGAEPWETSTVWAQPEAKMTATTMPAHLAAAPCTV
jgi:hypothetical protein